jgi:hypothetical protein
MMGTADEPGGTLIRPIRWRGDSLDAADVRMRPTILQLQAPTESMPVFLPIFSVFSALSVVQSPAP